MRRRRFYRVKEKPGTQAGKRGQGKQSDDTLLLLPNAIFSVVFEFLDNWKDTLVRCGRLNRTWKRLVNNTAKPWPRIRVVSHEVRFRDFVLGLPVRAVAAALHSLHYVVQDGDSSWSCLAGPVLVELNLDVKGSPSSLRNEERFDFATHARLRRLSLTFRVLEPHIWNFSSRLEALTVCHPYPVNGHLAMLPVVNLPTHSALTSLYLENTDFFIGEDMCLPGLTSLTILFRFCPNEKRLGQMAAFVRVAPNLLTLTWQLNNLRFTHLPLPLSWPTGLLSLHLLESEFTTEEEVLAIARLVHLRELSILMDRKVIKFGLSVLATSLTQLTMLQLLQSRRYPIFALPDFKAYPQYRLSISTTRSAHIWPKEVGHEGGIDYVLVSVGVSNPMINTFLNRGVHVLLPEAGVHTTDGRHTSNQCACIAYSLSCWNNPDLPIGISLFPDDDSKGTRTPQDMKDFKCGDLLDAMDVRGNWYVATVRQVSEVRICVHYINWSDKWDEWIDIPTDRLAPIYTHTEGVHRDPARLTIETMVKHHVPTSFRRDRTTQKIY